MTDRELSNNLAAQILDLVNDNIPSVYLPEGAAKAAYILSSALGCILAPCILHCGEEDFNKLLPKVVDIIKQYAMNTAKEVNDLTTKNAD
jgi:hypothetical protein